MAFSLLIKVVNMWQISRISLWIIHLCLYVFVGEQSLSACVPHSQRCRTCKGMVLGGVELWEGD